MPHTRSRRSIQSIVKAFWILLLGAIFLLLAVVARPFYHLMQVAWRDRDQATNPIPPGQVDDASRLNQTVMASRSISGEMPIAIEQLVQVLKEARTNGTKVTIAGARHTMGGQTIYANGLSLDLAQFNRMTLNSKTGLLSVQSGARWSAVIPYLNQHGYSVAVMQSNNDFSVGGTMNANAHGWQHDQPPFASTVERFRLMLADGRIVQCSRQDNAELFSLVLGGYGLFGVILDVELRVVPNELYSAQRSVISSREYVSTYRQTISPDVGMAYGRLSISPDHFLQEAILTRYHKIASAPTATMAQDSPQTPGPVDLARTVFRGSVGNDYGKQLRWQLEKYSGSEAGTQVPRNQILNRSSKLFADRQATSTEILQEYFIPPEFLEQFLEKCRAIIPSHRVDLLNVTIRNVYEDNDSFLRYADRELFGLVMLFHQQRTIADDQAMQALTEALVEAALSVGGRYYLPYRLHATPTQFRRAYPQADRFFALKRRYDPTEIFQNQFYLKYGKS
jgi:FAD/FMN-containing dehydrogenase